MKHTYFVLPLLLLLAIACNESGGGGGGGGQEENMVPYWVYDRIYEIENNTLPGMYAHIDHIWRSHYNGNPVYYFESYQQQNVDAFLFNKYGSLLGRGFSGVTPPDDIVIDYLYECTDDILIWEYCDSMNYRTPNWVLNLIDHVEKETDSTLTNSIWRYDYEGDPVYFLSTSLYQDYHRVYNIYGHYLGAPFGGPRNDGDGLLYDFFEERENQTFIWENNNYPVLAPSEEYAVISAALMDEFSNFNPIHVLDLTNNSSIYPDFIRSSLDYENIDYDTLMIDQYIQNNSSNYFLNDNELSTPIELISMENIYDLVHYDGWQAYWDDYPNSSDVLTLSRPGFDHDSTMAVMEYSWQMLPMSGSGVLVLLEKVHGDWRVVLTRGTWMSKK